MEEAKERQKNRIAMKVSFLLATRYHLNHIRDLEPILPEIMSPPAVQALRKQIPKCIRDTGVKGFQDGIPTENWDFYFDSLALELGIFNAYTLPLGRYFLKLSPEDSFAFPVSIQQHFRPFTQEEHDILGEWLRTAWQCDAEPFNYWNSKQKYSKIVAGHDWQGIVYVDKAYQSEAYQWISKGIGHEIATRHGHETRQLIWLLRIAFVIQSLSEDGRAFFSVPESIFVSSFTEIWEFLILQGCIESVIFTFNPYSDIPDEKKEEFMNEMNKKEVFLILRAPNPAVAKQGIFIYNAYFKSWQWLVDNKETIAEALTKEENRHSLDELKKIGYRLRTFVTNFLKDTVRIAITDLRRGSALSRKVLEETISETRTKYYYLGVADISDGLLWKPKVYLTDIPEKLNPYCLKDKTVLLITKNKTDSGYKTAVFNPNTLRTDEKILVGGNLYMMTLNEDKTDIYFVQAYLESAEGQKMLAELTYQHEGISMLSVTDMKQIRIPDCDIEVQHEIGAKFKQTLDAIRATHKKLEDLRQQRAMLFTNEINDFQG